jgi:hypothetical protein
MIGLALFAFVFASIGFASGVLASAYAPSLPLAGRRAMAATLTLVAGDVKQAEVIAQRPNKPIGPSLTEAGANLARAAANLLRAAGKALAFAVKHPVLALGLALVVFWLLAGSPTPFGWGKSKGELRLEAELARVQTELAQHETGLANLATSLSERTNRVREHARTVVQEAQTEIASAVDADDFTLLYSAYERNYRRVLAYDEPASGANPGAERAAPLPRASGGPV